ncbi:acetylglutamate kinase [Anaerotignum sp. MSJ-24]|uniref:acetylglutamate kinase n=1 Tax=Anaerotignum sp. MSJ-24 TaxID=2841521 RepID=UPI001C127F98|nr:acetylglutamate kinase [Anaerotignum sp. MSJ-24]MBD9219458.1 acetylglutamate kinase [Clostridiales bacterium]MBU5464680.1 acetylglutamate kinase [Anaerotignum sp. MSJ-24]
MELTNLQRAETIVHALPYIQKYYNKVVVIKYGGNAMINEDLKKAVMNDIVLLSLIGVKVVLVHGGGPEINSMLNKIGKKSEFVNGLRVTDAETIDTVLMVLAGKVNKSLVNLIECTGGKSVGLCGLDGHLIEAETLDEKLGYVGKITKVNIDPITDLLDHGYIPVVSTLGCDMDGHVYNINADTAAAKIAAEMKAESLISMTDICGILMDQHDPSTLVTNITPEKAHKLMEDGIIQGGMIPKVECCLDAIEGGVNRVFILDGTKPHAILMEMLTDEGVGTMFVREENK